MRLLVCLSLVAVLSAGDVPGPNVVPDATPPTDWDITGGKNLLWSVPLEHRTRSAPLIVGDAVITLAEPGDVICVGLDDGQERWRGACSFLETLAAGERAKAEPVLMAVVASWEQGDGDKEGDALEQRKQLDRQYHVQPLARYKYVEYGYTYSDPVSDGEAVYVYNGTTVAAAFDLKTGKRRWLVRPMLGSKLTTTASQPVLVDGKFILKTLADPDEKKRKAKGFVLRALDGQDGTVLWTTKPFAGSGHGEWGGQGVMELGGRKLVITPGGEVIDAADGKKLCHLEGAHSSYGIAAAVSGPYALFEKNLYKLAVAEDGAVAGELIMTFGKEARGPRCTAALLGGRAFAGNNGSLTVIDLATGKGRDVRWAVEGGNDRSRGRGNPRETAIAGKVGYHLIGKGEVAIFDVAAGGKLIGVRQLPGVDAHSTPAFSGTKMVVRTKDALVCIGK